LEFKAYNVYFTYYSITKATFCQVSSCGRDPVTAAIPLPSLLCSWEGVQDQVGLYEVGEFVQKCAKY
jgi:hypothetical protein